MAYRRVSPAELEGDELARWYRRSPEQVQEERALGEQLRYEEFVKSIRRIEDAGTQSPGWQEARLEGARPPPARTIPTPGGPRVGPSNRGAAPPAPEESDGFFAIYPNVGGHYFPLRPYPLSTVKQVGTDEFVLGDGLTAVNGAELQRIYDEQTRRMLGTDEPEPPPVTRSENRLRDGQIPLAGQLTKGVPEEDPTCHPFGGWELDPQFASYAQWTKDYEEQVTRAPGLDYVVRNPTENAVKFDGCAVWDRKQLLDAKGPGYLGLFTRTARYPYVADKVGRKLSGQAKRQARAARGRPIDWHVAEIGAYPHIERAVGDEPINVFVDAPRFPYGPQR